MVHNCLTCVEAADNQAGKGLSKQLRKNFYRYVHVGSNHAYLAKEMQKPRYMGLLSHFTQSVYSLIGNVAGHYDASLDEGFKSRGARNFYFSNTKHLTHICVQNP